MKQRLLVVPIWKEMNKDILDLLLAHEIGHALFTPQQEWKDAIEKEKIPSDLKRFMDRFIDKLQDKKLTRQKQKSILYKVVKGLGISPQELMMYVQRVKKGL